MKLKLLQENLKSALNQLQKAIPSKPQLPILSAILFDATDKGLVLSATDLYLGVKCFISAEIEETGTLAVPGEIFKQLVTALPAGKMSLETKESSLIIKIGSSVSKIPFQASEEYPQFPEISGEQQQFELSELTAMTEQVGFAISADQSRPVLTAMLFHFGAGELKVVGTDGFRLSVLKLSNHSLESSEKVLLPAKSVQEVARIAAQLKIEQISCQFDLENKQAKFLVGQTEMYIRLIEGEFPPYDKIIPTQFAHEVSFDRETLLAELKRALFFARETSNIVRFNLEGQILKILARSPSYGEYTGEIVLNGTISSPLEIAFNAAYLMDYLGAQTAEEIWLGANESLKPVMFKTANSQNQQYVVMPFRVSD
jgi:DNA polymerase-3 subunit beta